MAANLQRSQKICDHLLGRASANCVGVVPRELCRKAALLIHGTSVHLIMTSIKY